ncbi:hypothetical protein C8A01DRAFT_21547, partial [Parachaetomium inaequale]
IEILVLRFYLPKGKGNLSINVILTELGLLYLASSCINNIIGAPSTANILINLRTRADITEKKVNNILR